MLRGVADFTTTTVRSAKELPRAVWDAFEKSPQSANIMYAHAKQAAQYPSTRQSENLWIVGWNMTHSRRKSPEVAFVLSCTTHSLGKYPVFIFTPLSRNILVDDFVRPRILQIVRALREHAPPERVFSIFALDVLTHLFADLWTAETGVRLAANPVYYHSALMYCDRSTFRSRELPLLPDAVITLRLAVDADVKKTAALCRGFSETSVSFPTLPTSCQIIADMYVTSARNHSYCLAATHFARLSY